MEYNPEIWGPNYWFVLNTIGFTYPELPTDGEKKRYYNFITSLPYFIPNKAISENFSDLLDDYPVSSYLTSRESFLKWIHFIHNKINVQIGKEEISYLEFINNYNNLYKPKEILHKERFKQKEKYLYLSIISLLIGFILYKNIYTS
tara:strand:- start:4554 stop:4991 length:438 start_codon:yes stop_codon:yes gene_type:complete